MGNGVKAEACIPLRCSRGLSGVIMGTGVSSNCNTVSDVDEGIGFPQMMKALKETPAAKAYPNILSRCHVLVNGSPPAHENLDKREDLFADDSH